MPHQAMRVEKRTIKTRPMIMITMAWPTESPCAADSVRGQLPCFIPSNTESLCYLNLLKNVFGLCQFEMFKEDRVQYPKKWNHPINFQPTPLSSGGSIALHCLTHKQSVTEENLPHVRRCGGNGIRSRLLHASVCSCWVSSPWRRTFSFRDKMRFFNLLSMALIVLL